MTKYFPFGDRPPLTDEVDHAFFVGPALTPGRRYLATTPTGEFRTPKADEWYLSGAIPAAYQAPSGLTSAYLILRFAIVEVQLKEIE